MGSQVISDQGRRQATARSKAPVFVLGCGRSGTTLLYHMLLSAGNFAVYRTESNAINLLEPRFGDLSIRRHKAKLMAECRNGGDFLRTIMGEIARLQNVERWADCTPEHLLHLARIKATIP